jgi:hypothetical protein
MAHNDHQFAWGFIHNFIKISNFVQTLLVRNQALTDLASSLMFTESTVHETL